MTPYEVAFFVVHCLLHCLAYWLPNTLSAVAGLLLCRPCRRLEKRRHGYAYHPAHEVRVTHHPVHTEAAVAVFGLMDVSASVKEDRQYSCVKEPKAQREDETRASHLPDTAETRATSLSGDEASTAAPAAAVPSSSAEACIAYPPTATKALNVPTYVSPKKAFHHEIKRCHLRYDAPLYGPHVGTIMGAFRPQLPIPYIREEMRAWDGAYLAMDWLYVEGEAPCAYDHEHTRRERLAEKDNNTVVNNTKRNSGGGVSAHHCRGQSTTVRTAQQSTSESAVVASASGTEEVMAQKHRYSREGNRASTSSPSTGTDKAEGLIAEGREEGEIGNGDEMRKPAFRSVGGGGGDTMPKTEEEVWSDASRQRHVSPPPPPPPHTTTLDKKESNLKTPTSPAANARLPGKARGIVFLVPGLTSFSQTNYIQTFVRAMHAADLHVCVLTTRGMGDTPPVTTRFLFNGAYTRDVRTCLKHFFTRSALRRRFGHHLPVIGVGMSIGGAILSKYIGEEGIAGADPHLDALLCCCCPVDFVQTVAHMNQQYSQRVIYQPDMCKDVRNYIMRYPALQQLPNVDHEWVFAQGNIHRFRRIVHFDEHVLAASAGYRSVHHYHLDASAITWLPYAPIPVLAISAADDPVIGHTVMPHRWREITRDNARIVYVEPPVGGHLGFLGNPWAEWNREANWLEAFARDRILSACDYWYAVQRDAADENAKTSTTVPAEPISSPVPRLMKVVSLDAPPSPHTAYELPRPNRQTNRCYFTHYSLPTVPPQQLGQPYFIAKSNTAEKGATSAEEEAGRSASEAAVQPSSPRNPKCMPMAGQHTYAPVAVNCDYLVDPRTLMVGDV